MPGAQSLARLGAEAREQETSTRRSRQARAAEWQAEVATARVMIARTQDRFGLWPARLAMMIAPCPHQESPALPAWSGARSG